ncbi:PHD finger protein 7-like [Neopelma chrysocephalum]|uniref:PHD finger protein 7-like n=1 Tax=Neopelma chrysocephalum TaxID=114329 RepID=UPI000FCD4B15|nr:PHD finger protein 7-like [Neopelma chrysocephalum]
MSDSEEEEAPEEREPECLLCGRSEADPNICGEIGFVFGLCVHQFCLFFASDFTHLVHGEILNIDERDIQDAVFRAAQQRCCICGQSGATITCCERHCNLRFHLPCAKEGGCVTQFMQLYRGFCPTHSPQQAVEATPEPGTECLICMEPVEDRKTFNTLVCPACKTAWFHRDCIQEQAMCAGIIYLQCPRCRDDDTFLMDMFTMGIRMPLRGSSSVFPSPVRLELPWEENDAFAELRQRHRRCDASECLCPGGRQEAEQEGPWQLLLCSSCATEGTHRHCSGLRDTITSWECDGCAGLGTCKSQSTLVTLGLVPLGLAVGAQGGFG